MKFRILQKEGKTDLYIAQYRVFLGTWFNLRYQPVPCSSWQDAKFSSIEEAENIIQEFIQSRKRPKVVKIIKG